MTGVDLDAFLNAIKEESIPHSKVYFPESDWLNSTDEFIAVTYIKKI